jgi:transposase
LNEEKILEDQKWDGLKGYLTNSNLSPTQIMANYGELWKIEKAFRIAKNELKLRPVFHRLQRRIEAHICITFASYKVYKELERQLREKNTELSPRKAIEIAMSIIEIQIVTPTTKEKIKKLIVHSEEQKQLIDLFGA